MGLFARLRKKDQSGFTSRSEKDFQSRLTHSNDDDDKPVVVISNNPNTITDNDNNNKNFAVPNRPRASSSDSRPFSLLPIKVSSPGQHFSFSHGVRKNRSAPSPAFLQSVSSASLNVDQLQQRDSEVPLPPLPIKTSPRRDSLISSSLASSPNSGQLSLRQRQEEQQFSAAAAFLCSEDNVEEVQEITVTPPEERTTPLWDEVEVDADPSSSRAGRLLRRASGKLKDKRSLLRPTSRKEESSDDEEGGGTTGRSLGNNSSISLASIATTMSARIYRPSGDLLQHSRAEPHPPSVATGSAFRRARAASSASTKEIPAIPPASPNFSKPFSRGAGEKSDGSETPSLPNTNTGIGLLDFTTSFGQDESTVSPSRWKRSGGKSSSSSARPFTASSANPATTIQTYLSQLSPPPRGLAANDVEGRQALVCYYVQRKSLEEVRKGKNKINHSLVASLKLPITPSSPNTTSSCSNAVSMDSLIECLENELHRFMEEDFRQGANVQHYKELLLAEVFIEARRSLGLESGSARLHSMFDLNESQTPHIFSGESYQRRDEVINSTTTSTVSPSSPTFAWSDGNYSFNNSLTPAPRKRRPKTAPNEGRGMFKEDVALKTRTSTIAEKETSSPSLGSSSRRSSDAFQGSSGSMEGEAKEFHNQILTPSVFSSSKHYGPSPKSKVSSLPPSPPRSSESHTFSQMAECIDRPPSQPSILLTHHQRPISRVFPPDSSNE